MIDQITPLILTYNEAPNVARSLSKLKWAREVVVVDSFSTDETLSMARQFPNVRVVQRIFDNHASQWNFGVAQVQTEWVLGLDADYILPEELADEIRRLDAAAPFAAFHARFRYCIGGRPLRGTLYPRRAVLFRRSACRFEQDGHTQLLSIKGSTGELNARIDHDDRKPLGRWLIAQQRYAALEAEKLLRTPAAHLGYSDRLRKYVLIAPAAVFFYTLLAKGMIFDGWRGWYYALQRTYAELLLSLHLLEAKLGR